MINMNESYLEVEMRLFLYKKLASDSLVQKTFFLKWKNPIFKTAKPFFGLNPFASPLKQDLEGPLAVTPPQASRAPSV